MSSTVERSQGISLGAKAKNPQVRVMIMDLFGRMARVTERCLTALMVLALVVMIALVFVNVVLRYGFNSGISISVELSRFLFVWVTFLGAVVALLKQQHLGVTTLMLLLPRRFLPWLERLVTLMMLGCSLMLMVGAYKQTLLNWDNLSPISGIPVGIFYLAGLLAGVLMSIVLLYRFLVPNSLFAEPAGDD